MGFHTVSPYILSFLWTQSQFSAFFLLLFPLDPLVWSICPLICSCHLCFHILSNHGFHWNCKNTGFHIGFSCIFTLAVGFLHSPPSLSLNPAVPSIPSLYYYYIIIIIVLTLLSLSGSVPSDWLLMTWLICVKYINTKDSKLGNIRKTAYCICLSDPGNFIQYGPFQFCSLTCSFIISLFLIADSSLAYMYHVLCTHLPVHGHLGGIHFLALVNRTAMNTSVQVSL